VLDSGRPRLLVAPTSCSGSLHVRQTNARPIELTFLGTRGEIDVHSRRHRRHSALLVRHAEARIMIDCGADWLQLIGSLAPSAIVLTHAHPDHAWGLARGAPCPVYATTDTLALLRNYPLREPRPVQPRKPFAFGELSFEAFPVEHSIRAPAVGYRVSAATACFFYVPDVVAIRDRHRAVKGVQLYIGDGAVVRRSMVRRRGETLIGHAPIVAQLGWCEAEHVGKAVFTHCGSDIVRGDARHLNSVVRRLGSERGVEARIAYDGLRFVLRGQA
jgi:phosphoribosyl 1,2-cyclic phosphodiesterase